MKSPSIDLQLFGDNPEQVVPGQGTPTAVVVAPAAPTPAPVTPAPALAPPAAQTLLQRMTALGYRDGPEGMVKGEPPAPAVPAGPPAAPPTVVVAEVPTAATPAAGPVAPPPTVQPPAPEQLDRVGEALTMMAQLLTQQRPPVVQAPPEIPMPAAPTLPAIPAPPEGLKPENFENYFAENQGKAIMELIEYQAKVAETERLRQEITARYGMAKEEATRKRELTLGFYEQMQTRAKDFASLEPIATKILLKDQSELLQYLPPKLAIKVAFDLAARMGGATAPLPPQPDTPPAPGQAQSGQTSAVQGSQVSQVERDAIERDAIVRYIRRASEQGANLPPIPGPGMPPAVPATPIKSAADATRALRASLGLGGPKD